MKKIYSLIAAVLLTTAVWAQSPDKMSYQAVVRDANNNLVANASIGMQISILHGDASGSSIYTETQTPTSNGNGLISLEIGTGSTSDDFSTIDWAAGPYFIKTETDPTGGSNYTITGTSQLMSVPYALYAKTSGSSIPGPAGTNGVDGLDGTNGTDGADGNDGAAGAQGLIGLTGITGTQGAAGNDGAVGATGPVGADGVGVAQTLSQTGNDITLSDGGGMVTFTDTQLDEAAVDAYVGNNGYLIAEVDGSITNEIQVLSKPGPQPVVYLSNGGGSFIDAVNDADADPTNEIELPIGGAGGQVLKTDGSGNYTWVNQTVDTDTQLDEAAVDALVANNGYLIAELDDDPTNEIELPATGNSNDLLMWNGSAWVSQSITVALLPLSVNGIVDPGEECDDGNSTNGDGCSAANILEIPNLDNSSTNEIQTLSISGNDLTINGTGGNTVTLPSAGSSTFGTAANVTSNSNGDIATDDFVFGSTQLADAGGTDDNNRMYFDKSAAAFRVGTATGTEWNTPGAYSFAAGRNNTASGGASTITGGFTNTASALFATISGGQFNIASSDYTTIGGGVWNTASGDKASVIGGQKNIASGYYSTAGGIHVHAESMFEFAIGVYSLDAVSPTAASPVLTDRLFTIGNGTSDVLRSNALVLLKNGNLGLGVDEPTEKLEVNGSVKITDGTEGAGKILTSDANGKATWEDPSSSSGTHYLGEEFDEGIIYYLYIGSDGQQHGLIVNKTESTAVWQATGTNTSANRTEDGAYNTAQMTTSAAATYVTGLGAGWYLPSIDELALLYYNRFSANKALRAGGFTLLSRNAVYWSSVEYGTSWALSFKFLNGYAIENQKYNTLSVRAVRAF